MKNILVTGACGQIGSELCLTLLELGNDVTVVASDLHTSFKVSAPPQLHYEQIDCTDAKRLNDVISQFQIDTVFHMASILSAVAEQAPQRAWEVNMRGLVNVLEGARMNHCAVFFPSSIGAFGRSTPRDDTPQVTIQRPNSMYGITKVAAELLCDYYHERFDVDARGLRLPGLVSHLTSPGGGTTDYAVEMYRAACAKETYTCFLRADSSLDMMYMPDAVRAMIELMQADETNLVNRNAYNITAMSFSPAELFESIRGHVPTFKVDYQIDPVRQAIADSWPRSMFDGAARSEWGWVPEYDLTSMTIDMLAMLKDAGNIRPSANTSNYKQRHAVN